MRILLFAVLWVTFVALSAGIRRDYQEQNDVPATVTMFLLDTKTVTETVTAYIYGYPEGYSMLPTSGQDKPAHSQHEPTSSQQHAKPTSTTNNSNDWKSNMLRQVNAIRASVGKPALSLNNQLNSLAEAHSDYQASIKTMTHDDAAGELGARFTKMGVKWSRVAENVAEGYRDVSSAVKGWKNSPGHYRNMIGDYNVVGFGVNNNYWTQDFAKLR